jgi:hypothetical protein
MHFKPEMEFILIKPKKKGSAPEGGVTERPKVTTTTIATWCQGGSQGPVEPTIAREVREATASPVVAPPESSLAAAAPGCAERRYPGSIINLYNNIR